MTDSKQPPTAVQVHTRLASKIPLIGHYNKAHTTPLTSLHFRKRVRDVCGWGSICKRMAETCSPLPVAGYENEFVDSIPDTLSLVPYVSFRSGTLTSSAAAVQSSVYGS